MRKNKIELEIDFFKELDLPRPITCGLVNRIVSPKGLRKENSRGDYEYRLKDELIQIYEGKPANVEPGLYWVMDIFKHKLNLTWNHYLVVVEEECYCPVAEFVNCKDSTWIKSAMPIIKAFFAGDELDPVTLTEYKVPKKSKTRWASRS